MYPRSLCDIRHRCIDCDTGSVSGAHFAEKRGYKRRLPRADGADDDGQFTSSELEVDVAQKRNCRVDFVDNLVFFRITYFLRFVLFHFDVRIGPRKSTARHAREDVALLANLCSLHDLVKIVLAFKLHSLRRRRRFGEHEILL